MIYYAMLFAAILLEVAGTMMLPASQGFTKPLPTVALAVCYLAAFYLLAQVVKVVPVSIVYATWSGLGVFSVAVLGYILWQQSLHIWAMVGMMLIVAGVVLVNVFAVPHG